MEIKHNYNRIDLAKSIGPRQYTVLERDHLELRKQLEQHPLTSGLWAVGKYFIIIGEVQTWKTIYLSDTVEAITGYSHQEAFAMGADLLIKFTHPEDFPINMAKNQKGIQWLYQLPESERQYATATHYYRGIRKDGKQVFIQHQSFPIGFDAYNMPYVFANVCTDISHLNMPFFPRTFVLNRKSGELIEITNEAIDKEGQHLKISKREKEVLSWLSQGYSSKEIAEQLSISVHTVQTYRKRLLEKTQVKNTSELINFAYLHSLID